MPTEKIENPKGNIDAKSVGIKQKLHSLFREMRKNRCAYYMLLPFFVLFLLFTVLPIVAALPLAFTDFRMPDSIAFAGVENFVALFSENDLFISALKNTLLSLLITGLGGFVLSILAAWLVSSFGRRLNTRWTRAMWTLRTVFIVIFCLPSFVYGAFAVWGLVLGGEMNSPLNSVLMSWGIITSPQDWLSQSPASILLVQAVRLWGTFGIGFLVVLSGFDEAAENRELYEAGQIDGLSNRFQQLIFITVPACAPRLALAAALQISASFSVGSLFTTTPENMTLTDYMLHFGVEKFDIGMASAIGILLAASASLIYFIVRKLLHRLNG